MGVRCAALLNRIMIMVLWVAGLCISNVMYGSWFSDRFQEINEKPLQDIIEYVLKSPSLYCSEEVADLLKQGAGDNDIGICSYVSERDVKQVQYYHDRNSRLITLSGVSHPDIILNAYYARRLSRELRNLLDKIKYVKRVKEALVVKLGLTDIEKLLEKFKNVTGTAQLEETEADIKLLENHIKTVRQKIQPSELSKEDVAILGALQQQLTGCLQVKQGQQGRLLTEKRQANLLSECGITKGVKGILDNSWSSDSVKDHSNLLDVERSTLSKIIFLEKDTSRRSDVELLQGWMRRLRTRIDLLQPAVELAAIEKSREKERKTREEELKRNRAEKQERRQIFEECEVIPLLKEHGFIKDLCYRIKILDPLGLVYEEEGQQYVHLDHQDGLIYGEQTQDWLDKIYPVVCLELTRAADEYLKRLDQRKKDEAVEYGRQKWVLEHSKQQILEYYIKSAHTQYQESVGKTSEFIEDWDRIVGKYGKAYDSLQPALGLEKTREIEDELRTLRMFLESENKKKVSVITVPPPPPPQPEPPESIKKQNRFLPSKCSTDESVQNPAIVQPKDGTHVVNKNLLATLQQKKSQQVPPALIAGSKMQAVVSVDSSITASSTSSVQPGVSKDPQTDLQHKEIRKVKRQLRALLGAKDKNKNQPTIVSTHSFLRSKKTSALNDIQCVTSESGKELGITDIDREYKIDSDKLKESLSRLNETLLSAIQKATIRPVTSSKPLLHDDGDDLDTIFARVRTSVKTGPQESIAQPSAVSQSTSDRMRMLILSQICAKKYAHPNISLIEMARGALLQNGGSIKQGEPVSLCFDAEPYKEAIRLELDNFALSRKYDMFLSRLVMTYDARKFTIKSGDQLEPKKRKPKKRCIKEARKKKSASPAQLNGADFLNTANNNSEHPSRGLGTSFSEGDLKTEFNKFDEEQTHSDRRNDESPMKVPLSTGKQSLTDMMFRSDNREIPLSADVRRPYPLPQDCNRSSYLYWMSKRNIGVAAGCVTTLYVGYKLCGWWRDKKHQQNSWQSRALLSGGIPSAHTAAVPHISHR